MNCEGGSAEPLSIMYGSLLRNYEEVKEEYTHVRKRYDDLAASHSAADAKLEHSQVGQHFELHFFLRTQILHTLKLLKDMLTIKNVNLN